MDNKNYVVDEYTRNVEAKPLYCQLLRAAFGADVAVMVSHHITVMLPDSTVHEIPSADTILFDHNIMSRVFGPGRSQVLMTKLAQTPAARREAVVGEWMADMGRGVYG